MKRDTAAALLDAARQTATLSASTDWAQRLQSEGLRAFEAQGLPHPRQESWRFTSLRPLMAHDWKVMAPASGSAPFILDGPRIVLVDGHLDSAATVLPEGLTVLPLTKAMESHAAEVEPRLGQIAKSDENAFVAFSQARLEGGIFLHLAAGMQLDAPVELLMLNHGDFRVVAPRILLVLGEGSSLQLVEVHRDLGEGPRLVMPTVEIELSEGAELEHTALFHGGSERVHIQNTRARIGKKARCEQRFLAAGEGFLRHDPIARLVGEAAHAGMHGLACAAGEQVVDHHTAIEHLVAGTTSEEIFRHVLTGKSRAVFAGRVLVAKDAQQTDAAQDNRTLLLSDDAQINSMPQLEIYADDVKCSHGATVGELDAQQLFYLRSRGVPAIVARDLLTYAFANEVVEEIPFPAVRERLRRRLFERLPHENLDESIA